MRFEQLVRHFGTQVAIAEAAGVRQPTVSMWKARGQIPPLQQLKFEQLTDGKLKASKSILQRKVSRK